MFTPLALVRLVWFVVFFVMARRAHVLTGKNVFTALAAGFGTAIVILIAPEAFWPFGLADWIAPTHPLKDRVLEGTYLILFPPLFALLRRLFKLRGFGRDFGLVAAMMAPLFWIMFMTAAFLYLSFHPGPL